MEVTHPNSETLPEISQTLRGLMCLFVIMTNLKGIPGRRAAAGLKAKLKGGAEATDTPEKRAPRNQDPVRLVTGVNDPQDAAAPAPVAACLGLSHSLSLSVLPSVRTEEAFHSQSYFRTLRCSAFSPTGDKPPPAFRILWAKNCC